MSRRTPPAIAAWLLEHVGRRNQPLAGDLLEQYGNGRSVAWYWRQVLTAIAVDGSKAVLIVIGMIALYRIGTHIPVPGANSGALALLAGRATGILLAKYNLVAGGNLVSVTVFALGIAPFVSASIVVQLALLAWWILAGRPGTPWQLPIVRATWIVAVLLSLGQAAGLAVFLERQDGVAGGLSLVSVPGWEFRVSMLLTLTAGSACLMWIGDRITEHRIGNGMLLVFVAALLAGLPHVAGVSGMALAVRQLVLPVTVVAVTSHGYRRAFNLKSDF